jgi:hypothetical protein
MMRNRSIARTAPLLVSLVAVGCAGSGGAVYVLDTAKGIDCNGYTPTVKITGISPAAGRTAGGETVTVTGSGFDVCADMTATLAYIGTKTATKVRVTSDSKITCVTPPGPAGRASVSVQVTTVGNRGSATGVFDGFTYQ